MTEVKIHIDDNLWDRLLERVKISRQTSKGDWEKAVAKEIRCAFQEYLGPDPKSVIHEIKRKEREAAAQAALRETTLEPKAVAGPVIPPTLPVEE